MRITFDNGLSTCTIDTKLAFLLATVDSEPTYLSTNPNPTESDPLAGSVSTQQNQRNMYVVSPKISHNNYARCAQTTNLCVNSEQLVPFDAQPSSNNFRNDTRYENNTNFCMNRGQMLPFDSQSSSNNFQNGTQRYTQNTNFSVNSEKSQTFETSSNTFTRGDPRYMNIRNLYMNPRQSLTIGASSNNLIRNDERCTNMNNFYVNPEQPLSTKFQNVTSSIHTNPQNIITHLPSVANLYSTYPPMVNLCQISRMPQQYYAMNNSYGVLPISANTLVNGGAPINQNKTVDPRTSQNEIKNITFPHRQSNLPASSDTTLVRSDPNTNKDEVMSTEYENPFNYSKFNVAELCRLKTKDLPPQVFIKWMCLICCEDQKNKQSLMDHYEFHKEEKDKLDAKYTDTDSNIQNHGNIIKKHECETCNQFFADAKALNRHLYTHSIERALCYVCGKVFGDARKLSFHLKTHSDDRRYLCKDCGKSFYKSNDLVSHSRTHSGEKPYKCETCEKCFTQRSSLVIHQRLHTGERPYVCPTCNKGCVSRSTLNSHRKSCR